MTRDRDDLYRDLNSSFAEVNAWCAEQMPHLHQKMNELVREAYDPWPPLSHAETRQLYEDMTVWRRKYLARTKPTWNERVVFERIGDQERSNVAFYHVRDSPGHLVESSDHTQREPGWYAVCVEWISPSFSYSDDLPHLTVQRVYPEDADRELTYLRRTYQHPSREYAHEIARQILYGEILVWAWNRRGGYADHMHTGDWRRCTPVDIRMVSVYRQHTNVRITLDDRTEVTRRWLQERGAPS